MRAPKNAKKDETAGCGLRGLEIGRGGSGSQSSSATVSGGNGPSSAVLHGRAPYKIIVSATREVCHVVLPRHSKHCQMCNIIKFTVP